VTARYRETRDARGAGGARGARAPVEKGGKPGAPEPQGDAPVALGRFAVIASRTNPDVVLRLLEGAVATLKRHGATEERIEVFQVPGAFELPLGARRAARSGRFDAVIALGAVIRGGTPHFEYICSETARGLMSVSLETDVPVLFGVLTTSTRQDALDRAGGKMGNKGAEAAIAAIEMASLAVGRP
jgi:6,7-dimethyl-8-ribityllumazine synthase